MKRLNSKELRSLNECAYHTMSNEQLDENILGAIGKGLFNLAKGTGSVAARTTSAVGRSGLKRSAISRVGRARKGIKQLGQDVADKISDIRTGTTTASSARAAQRAASAPGAAQRAAAKAQELGLRRADYADAIRRGKANPNASADDILRMRRAERALADDKLDEVESLINPARGGAAAVAARGSSGLATGVAAGTGAAVGSAGGGQQGFLSKQFGEVEDAALQGAAENVFGDIRRTFANTGKAVGSRINVQNRFRGLR
jgi:hypothetical protein